MQNHQIPEIAKSFSIKQKCYNTKENNFGFLRKIDEGNGLIFLTK